MVSGTKRHASRSSVQVATASVAFAAEPLYSLRTSASHTSERYKQQIYDQLRGTSPLPAGAVELDLSFTVGSGRTWLNLWKPTIDALGPLLGQDDPKRHWHPRDGRITRLGLHSQVDAALGYDVLIAVRAAPVA